MSIIDTNPHRFDVSPGLREMLMRNGIQARVAMNNDGKPVLIVKGHDSPVIEYNISDRQLNDLVQWSSSYQSVNRQAYNTFVGIVKKDFDCPIAYVHAKNAFSRVATGLHGYRIGVGEYGNYPRFHGGWRDALYGFGHSHEGFRTALLWGGGGPFHGRRIGGQYFANYTTPWVPERPDGRLKPGEMQSGGYGFYWKGNRQEKQEVKVEKIQPVELKPAPRDKNVVTWYSPSAWSKSHWNDILDSHGIVVDEKKGTITIQSRALRADVTFTEKDDPAIKSKIKAIMCKDLAAEPQKIKKGVVAHDNKTSYSVAERIFLLNGIIDDKFKDKVTLDMLKKGEMIDIEAKPEFKAVIEKDFIVQDKRKAEQQRQEVRQNQVKYAEELYKQEIDRDRYRIYSDPAAVNGREIASVLGEKGWFVNRNHGRELNVGEIRVDKVNDKYYMSADVNGEIMQKEISAKSYGKFLNYDDAHRMNMFASTFNEVKIGTAAVEGGRSVYDYGNESAFRKNNTVSFDDRLATIQGGNVDAQAIADYAASRGVAVNPEARQIAVNNNSGVAIVPVDAEKMNILKGNNFDPFSGGMTVQQRLDYLNSVAGGNYLTMDGMATFAVENRDEIGRRNVAIGQINAEEIAEKGHIGVKPAAIEPISEGEGKGKEISFKQMKPEKERYVMTDGAERFFSSNDMIQKTIGGGVAKVSDVRIEKTPTGSYMLHAKIDGKERRNFVSSEKAERFAHSDNMGKMRIVCDELLLDMVERSKVDNKVLDILNKGQFITDADGKDVVKVDSITAEKSIDGNYVLKMVANGEDGKRNMETFSMSKEDYKIFSQGDNQVKMDILQMIFAGKFNFSGDSHNDDMTDNEKTAIKDELDKALRSEPAYSMKDEYKLKVGSAEVCIVDKDHRMFLSAGGDDQNATLSDKDFDRFIKGDDEKRKEIIMKYFPGQIDKSCLNTADKYRIGGLDENCSLSFSKADKGYVALANIGDDVFKKGISAKEYEQFKTADNNGKAALLDKWMGRNVDWMPLADSSSKDKAEEVKEGKKVTDSEQKGTKKEEKNDERASIWENRLSDRVDGASIKDVNAKKGWFREGEGGREVTVGEIRVEKLPGMDKDGGAKFAMSAVINGQVVTHEISQKQYDKFLAMDDGGRMKYFAKIFPEVDLKTLPGQKTNIGKAILNGLACVTGVVAGVALGMERDRHYHHGDIEITRQGYFKPGVGDGTVLVARDVHSMAAANFNDADDRGRGQDADLDRGKGMGV